VIVPLNPPHAIEYRQCPKCAYVLAQSMIADMRFDPKCPRCLGARVSQFLPFMAPLA
jgi:hypothetical protein